MKSDYTPLAERPNLEQPDEKLWRWGPEYLSDTELLAILLRTGSKGQSAIELSQKIYWVAGNNIQQLARLKPSELIQIKGVGKIKALIITASMELARRRNCHESIERVKIGSSKDVASFLQQKYADLDHEIFGVVYLNRGNRVILSEVISKGGITGTVADVRIILKNALLHSATSILLFHNHPSGNLQASQADILLTQKIKSSASVMDIQVLDHLIVSIEGYLSFLDDGLI